MSSTISIVCSISMLHSCCSSAHTGRTSIDIVCQVESKSLCPSSRLAIPARPLHGSNLRNGVKFSVQTTSRGSAPCRRCRLPIEVFAWSPRGSKVMTGRVVRVESMKFIDAQNKPASALLSVIQRAKALESESDASQHPALCTHSSSVPASSHAHISTPVPPSFTPSHGLVPQLSASHLPVLNLKCSSFAWTCWRI